MSVRRLVILLALTLGLAAAPARADLPYEFTDLGSALSDLEHVGALDELEGLIGAQHPESATWVNKGKFWFKAKRGYLTNEGECCLAQFGPDGKIRAVEFDEKLSEPEKRTKLRYRIRWKGGYQTGPGQ